MERHRISWLGRVPDLVLFFGLLGIEALIVLAVELVFGTRTFILMLGAGLVLVACAAVYAFWWVHTWAQREAVRDARRRERWLR